ncbi:3-dehydroquinate synthase [Corynebacterium phoceense]|uniref:3-dehydroquinate synthase n=1 Tax=Corynebacterium phoceense TaxID=1686286 RepID=UPI001D92115D|nr:3-dehydroquinate synthase [Corynebacterium phoceense]MCQ9332675.1 3-dehydroquinate synthase [Corynebacterium phoceense]MCQ9335759.1 3-dehydroquinate synthase [Corynebacterium phoceense]HJG43621.1 3-dehydroquinate synthase [Corynebacterium phoceense]
MIQDTVAVNGPSPYVVSIGHDLSDDIVARVRTIGARNVGIVHQPALAAAARQIASALESLNVTPLLLPIPDAEAGKTLAVCGELWDQLGEANFSRADALIGLGGGAATDLAGFVASGWMRGIKVIQAPTTLLAMVDAAVGGKTGINTEAGKNLVGAFHEPDSVFVDLNLLRTLPQDELGAGSAEIIKTGFIHDPVIIERYLADPAACLDVDGFLPELVTRSITVKAHVVGQDLKESGLRETLNYGHTFGHAVELREHYTWRHGNAVAVGMMFIANLSAARGLITPELLSTHRAILTTMGLPTTYEGGHFEELYAGMTHDKKNRGGHIRFVALSDIGATTRIEDATEDEMRAAYEAISE